MRTFVAVDISEEMKGVLGQIESHLKYAGADVKWVDPAAIHLTLKFLGEIDEAKCALVKSALDTVAAQTAPFEMTVNDIGAFPRMDHPRVIWVGLGRGAEELAALARRIEDAFGGLGFAREERPFSPHLTIGRVRSPLNKDNLKTKAASASAQFIPLDAIPHRVTSVILYKSTLTPHGSIYTELHRSALIG